MIINKSLSVSAVTNQCGKINAVSRDGKLHITYTGPTLSHETVEKVISAMVTEIDNSIPQILQPSDKGKVLDTPEILWPVLDIEVRTLPLLQYGNQWESTRALNGMMDANIRYLGQLVQRTEKQIITGLPRVDWPLKHFGRKCLKVVKDCISPLGVHFGMDILGWVPPDERLMMPTEQDT